MESTPDFNKIDIIDFMHYLDENIYDEPKKYLNLLSDLKRSLRYITDSDFKLLVNSYIIRIYAILNDYYKALEAISNLEYNFNDKANHYVICQTYYFIAAIYLYLNLNGDNVKTNLKIIEYEKKSGFQTNASALAYNNIAHAFERLGNYELALKYYTKGFHSVTKNDKYIVDYNSEKYFILLNIAHIYTLLDDFDKTKECLDMSTKIKYNKEDKISKYILNVAKINYYGNLGDKDNLIKCYFLAKEESLKTINYKEDLWLDIINLYKYYEKDLVDVNIMERELDYVDSITKTNTFSNVYIEFYEIYIEFFRNRDDKSKVQKAYEKYMFFYKKFEENKIYFRKLSLQFHNEIEKLKRENELISIKKQQLDKANKKLNEQREKLDEVSYKLSRITETGQSVLEFTNEQDAIDNIHKDVKTISDIKSDTFTVFMLEKDNKLHCKYLFENGEKDDNHEELILPLDDDGNIVECFNTGNSIKKTFNQQNDIKYFLYGEVNIKSAIFLPLKVGEKITGVLSMQTTEEDAYSDLDIKTLKLFLPFYAISIQFAREKEEIELNIQKRKRQNAKLQEITKQLEIKSKLDALTGIMNRKTFDDEFENLLEKSNLENLPSYVYMFDIDNFKLYNDTYGHLTGDDALKKIASTISTYFDGNNSIFGRYGGEEFIACDIGIDEKSVLDKSNKIIESIYNLNIENKKAPLKILTVSLGLSICSDCKYPYPKDMIRLADENLYHAKNTGKNQMHFSYFKN